MRQGETSDSLYRRRVQLLAATRAWFARQGFAEVDTPVLTPFPETSPHLEPFHTTDGFFLATSPEYGMKQVLGADLPRIYQISHFFRRGERTALHLPEFLGVEWYRLDGSYTDLMEDCASLVQHLAKTAGAFPEVSWNERTCHLGQPFETVAVEEAFQDATGKTATAMLAGEGEEAYFRTLLEKIEPRLGAPRLSCLVDYPHAQGLLARRKPGARHLCERFELYLCGVELANGWTEDVSAAGLEERAAEDARLAPGRTFDPYYLQAARDGHLPPCAGVALGLERLFQVLLGVGDLADMSPLSRYLERRD